MLSCGNQLLPWMLHSDGYESKGSRYGKFDEVESFIYLDMSQEWQEAS